MVDWGHRLLLQSEQEPEPDGGGGNDRDVPEWMFIVIPMVSAIVGYGTNVIALRMSFYPLEFKGIKLWQPQGQPFGLFGWQGIVPTRARIMASRLTELFMSHLLNLEEMFGRIDPDIVRARCEPATRVLTTRVSKETLDVFFPNVYTSLHAQTRKEITRAISDQSAEMVTRMMAEIQSRIMDLLNLVSLMGRLAEENKDKVVTMFLEVGKREYRFVELSGFFFGFLFGCVQAVIYYFYDGWWVLPAAGLIVGWFTNYLAIKLIFEPAEPIHILGWNIQGVFLKRQQEAAVSIADLSQSNFLTVEHMMNEIVYGEGQSRFNEILHRVAKEYIDNLLSGLGGMLSTLFTSQNLAKKLEDVLVFVSQKEMVNVWPLAYDHIEEALDLKETLRTKLQALPPKEFVGTLRPVFQEDELKLIIVGALLGMLVGFAQQFLIFHWI